MAGFKPPLCNLAKSPPLVALPIRSGLCSSAVFPSGFRVERPYAAEAMVEASLVLTFATHPIPRSVAIVAGAIR